MDLCYSPEEVAFRTEVRTFLAHELPAELAAEVKDGRRLSKAEHEAWQAILAERGWLAPHWPVEYGGVGWSVVERIIFELETALAHAPLVIPFGLSMLALVLIKFGREDQKRHWLGRMLRGEDWWCQGYSEPGAGSDLANIKTTAVRDGDDYVINGQKTWTTLGRHQCCCGLDGQAGGTQRLLEHLCKSALSNGGLTEYPLAEASNFRCVLITRAAAQEVHLALDAAETLPTKPDQASRVDFGLCEPERFKRNAETLDGRCDNE